MYPSCRGRRHSLFFSRTRHDGASDDLRLLFPVAPGILPEGPNKGKRLSILPPAPLALLAPRPPRRPTRRHRFTAPGWHGTRID